MAEFFDLSEVRRVLQGFNPWWARKAFTLPNFHRLAFNVCRRHLHSDLRRAILLSGPRRVAKTTILLQIAKYLVKETADPASVFFVSLDHPLLKLVPLNEILRIYHDSIYPEARPVVLLMDEVQY